MSEPRKSSTSRRKPACLITRKAHCHRVPYGGHVGVTAMNEHHELFGGLIICDLMVLRLERLKAHFAGGRPLRSDTNRPNKVYPDYAAAKSICTFPQSTLRGTLP